MQNNKFTQKKPSQDQQADCLCTMAIDTVNFVLFLPPISGVVSQATPFNQIEGCGLRDYIPIAMTTTTLQFRVYRCSAELPLCVFIDLLTSGETCSGDLY